MACKAEGYFPGLSIGLRWNGPMVGHCEGTLEH